MITSIITVGNSKGIRIPKPLLKESGLEEDVELKVKKGEIKIIPAVKRKATNPNLILSEKVLATDWMRQEENKAWQDLQ